MSIYYFEKSSVLFWPVKFVKLETCNLTLVEFDMKLTSMVLKPLLTWDHEYVVGAGFAWKSWAYQCKVLTPNVIRGMQPGVRAFVDSPGPLLEVATKAAWWDMSRTDICEYAKEFAVELAPGANMCDILWAFCMKLGFSDEQSLTIVHKRVATDQQQDDVTATLLELDEAVEVLDRQDEHEISTSQKQAQERRVATAALKSEYRARVQLVRAAKPAAVSQEGCQSCETEASACPH